MLSVGSGGVGAHLFDTIFGDQRPVSHVVWPKQIEPIARADTIHPFALIGVVASAEIDLVDMIDIYDMLEKGG